MSTEPAITLPTFPQVAHLDQYFGAWAMEPTRFQAMLDQVARMDLAAHVAEGKPLNSDEQPAGLCAVSAEWVADGGYGRTPEGVAILDIQGTMTKYGSSFSSGGGTVRARQRLRAAMRDDAVRSIVLRIDSPGGMVAGNKDLSDDVRAAAEKKPLMAYIEDLGASAAYWVASQADKIFANDMATVGSIGTYGVIDDWSGFYAQKGIKTHVLSTGAFKGAGVEGAPVTERQIAYFQGQIDQLNSFFLSDVSNGRKKGLGWVKELADGRTWIGQKAMDLGLIDQISNFESAVAYAASKLKTRAPRMKG